MKRLLIVVSLLMLALPSLASAQDHQTASKTDLTFSEPIIIGGATLSPGTYRFTCKLIQGEHVMIVTSLANGKELARVSCKPLALDAKVAQTTYRSVKTANGKVLSDVRIKGESIAHKLAVPAE